jgi:hypothetical protein
MNTVRCAADSVRCTGMVTVPANDQSFRSQGCIPSAGLRLCPSATSVRANPSAVPDSVPNHTVTLPVGGAGLPLMTGSVKGADVETGAAATNGGGL